ncbi:MAG: hypothetical protein ACR2NW_02365 [Thermodesulfobacteriota bacterium]
MDSFSIYKYESDKPFLILRLDISGKIMHWLIPKSTPIKKSVKRLAVEIPDGAGKKKEAGQSLLVNKSEIKIKYLGKRKIIFGLIRTKQEVNDFVLLVPSWGLRTERKLWVLIPV